MKLESPAFQAGAAIPKKYTGEGPDLSPPLVWSEVPDGACELALICDDPDAPTAQPWVHWVIWGLDPKLTGLPEGLGRQATLSSPAASQGRTDFGRAGYGGPMPPRGHGVHRYSFRLFALGQKLKLVPGATKAQLLQTIQGRILAEASLLGTYERK